LKIEIKKPEDKEEKKNQKKDERAKPDAAAQNKEAGAESAKSGDKQEDKKDDKKKEARVKIEILDSTGKVVRTYPPKHPPTPEGDENPFARNRGEEIPTEAGINRFVWDLHHEPTPRIPNSPLWGGSTDAQRPCRVTTRSV